MSTLQYDEATTRQLEAVYLGPDIVAQRARTMELLGLKPGERVLDIGSGPGFLCADMAAAVGPQGRVRGIDISPVMVARAAGRNPEGWVSFATGDATRLDEADASYDAVVSVQVAEYVPDVDAFCREAFRVLRPGGRALVVATDWDAIAWYSRDPARMQRVLAAFAPHCADTALPRTLGRHLRAAGFALDAVTPFANLPREQWSALSDPQPRLEGRQLQLPHHALHRGLHHPPEQPAGGGPRGMGRGAARAGGERRVLLPHLPGVLRGDEAGVSGRR